jgi:hypothetical protein
MKDYSLTKISEDTIVTEEKKKSFWKKAKGKINRFQDGFKKVKNKLDEYQDKRNKTELQKLKEEKEKLRFKNKIAKQKNKLNKLKSNNQKGMTLDSFNFGWKSFF